MSTIIFWRYLHFISIFLVVGALTGEHLLLKNRMTRKEIGRMAQIDLIYGISAITLVGAGLMLWLVVGKPADFYSSNWIFILKVGLAISMGLLSLPPTIFFLKNRKGTADEYVDLPAYIKILIRIELLLLLLIPLCAVFMAQGVGSIY